MSAVSASLQKWTEQAPRTSASIAHREGDRWHTLEDLVTDIGPRAEGMSALYGAGLPLGGSFLVARVARAVVEPSLFSLLAVGAAPRLAPEEVAFHLDDDGRVDHVAFGGETGGPDDAASFAGEIFRTFEPVVGAFRRAIPLGRRGIWALVTDAVGGAAVALHASNPRALPLAEEVLARLDVASSLSAHAAWVVRGGHAEQRRRSCCLAFQLDDHGYCDTCPVGSRPVDHPPPLRA